MEWAFFGPYTLRDRLDGHLDVTTIAELDEDTFVGICCAKPAIHRFPAAMGRRIHEMSRLLADKYDDDPSRLWTTAPSGVELYARLRELPGYGEEKARIFSAILAKRFGVRPAGWEEVAGPFADGVPRTVADVDSPESLARVREFKKAMKAAKKDKQSRPIANSRSGG